eukprot:TRINITY_DN44487_c0_g1_i1.p1 TRINITY_DN44487_c0_g1~~TRINITY_DN44487_c0_g1_i1.p1  ORF type:complete len:398 (+),score=73.20 TRINITY_DN44487_c0_g1_i1:66-1259(+)
MTGVAGQRQGVKRPRECGDEPAAKRCVKELVNEPFVELDVESANRAKELLRLESEYYLLNRRLGVMSEDLPSHVTQALSAVCEAQRFLETFEYSFAGPSFATRKKRPLSDILTDASTIVRERTTTAIQCIEAAFVGLYLTQGLRGVTRFGISLASQLPCGYRYYHQVLGIAVRISDDRHVFGAMALSRDFGLASKPCVFSSLADMLRNYRVHYRRAGHTPVAVQVGRPVHNGKWSAGCRRSQFSKEPAWIQEEFSFGESDWYAQVDSFQQKLTAQGYVYWPPPSCRPYRRVRVAGVPALDTPTVPTPHARATPHPARACTPDRPTDAVEAQTPSADCVGQKAADGTAPCEYASRVRKGQFRSFTPGRVSFTEVLCAVDTIARAGRAKVRAIAAAAAP